MKNQIESHISRPVPDPEGKVIVQDYWSAAYHYGRGHDPLQNSEKASPFKPESLVPDAHRAPEGGGRMTYARTFTDLAEKLELDLGLEYGYIFPDATVAGKLVDAFSRSEESVRIVGYYRQAIGLSDLTGSKPQPDFSEDANTLIENKDWDAFFQKYGAYFCDGIQTGGDLFVHTAITATSIKDAKSLEVAIDNNVTATNPAGFYGSLKKVLDNSGIQYTSSTDSFVKGAVVGTPEYDGENLESAAAGLIDYINNFVEKIDDKPSPMAAQMRGYWSYDSRLSGLKSKLIQAKKHAYKFEALAAKLFDMESCIAEVEVWIAHEGLTETEDQSTERGDIMSVLVDWGVLLRNCYTRMSKLSDYEPPSGCPELRVIDLDFIADRIAKLRRDILDGHLVFGEFYNVQFTDDKRYFSEPSKHKPSSAKTGSEVDEPEKSNAHPYISLAENLDDATVYQILPAFNGQTGKPVKMGQQIRIAYPDDAENDKYQGYQIYMSKVWSSCLLDEYDYDSRIQHRWKTRQASDITYRRENAAITVSQAVSLRNAHGDKWDMIADEATLKVSDDPDDDNGLIFTRPLVLLQT